MKPDLEVDYYADVYNDLYDDLYELYDNVYGDYEAKDLDVSKDNVVYSGSYGDILRRNIDTNSGLNLDLKLNGDDVKLQPLANEVFLMSIVNYTVMPLYETVYEMLRKEPVFCPTNNHKIAEFFGNSSHDFN